MGKRISDNRQKVIAISYTILAILQRYSPACFSSAVCSGSGSASFFEAMEALQEINKNLGAEIVLEYSKGIFTYRKPKQPTQKKETEESTAVRLAKRLGNRGMSEKERMAIIAHYTR